MMNVDHNGGLIIFNFSASNLELSPVVHVRIDDK